MEPIIKWKVLEGVGFDLFNHHISLESQLHPRTLIMTWVVLTILTVFVLLATRRLTSGKPGKVQNVLEWIVDFVRGMMGDNMDYRKGAGLFSYLITLIMFIFLSNMMGLVPNFLGPVFSRISFAQLDEMFGHATLQSPTADVNVTMSIALMTFVLIFVMGIKTRKGAFGKHFLEPAWPFAIIHAIDYLMKPVTLAFRLFGNIFAGEVLIFVIIMLPTNLSLIGALGGVLPMAVWIAFSIFIGTIQAYIFTVLTTAFIGQAMSSDH